MEIYGNRYYRHQYEKELNTWYPYSKEALNEWSGFDPTEYRAYVHFKNSDQLGEEQ